MSILSIEHINKRFGGLAALSDVSFDVDGGEIKGLIGPNGAGKTTLFDVLTGIYLPDSGTVTLKEKKLIGLKPDEVTGLGMIRTFQTIKLFEGMTVLENVMVGCHSRTKSGMVITGCGLPPAFREERDILNWAMEKLEMVALDHRAGEIATNLPYGQQRLLEMARALVAEPEIILLDEPAAGLNPYETAELSELLQRLQDGGLTILLVEHDMGLVMGISNEVVVLDYGEIIARGTPEDVQNDPKVIEAYLGMEVD